MKPLLLFAFVATVAAAASTARAQSPASNQDPYWVHQAKDHWYDEQVISGRTPPSLVFGLDAPNLQGSFGLGSLFEMERLFGNATEPGDVDLNALRNKFLLSLPLLRNGNLTEILFRPQGDLYATYAKRASVRHLNADARITPPPGGLALDLHVHTCYSHDSLADPVQMLRAAAYRGLSGIAITDHNTMGGVHKAQEALPGLIREGKAPASFLVIPGEEISSAQGHIVGLFLTQEIAPGMSAAHTVEEIHAQGGIAIAAHPQLPDGVKDLANALPFDAVETENAAEEMHFAMARHGEDTREAFYRTVRKPAIGSSDAHDPAVVGACYTVMENCPATADGVRAAILAGRTQADTRFDDSAERRALRRGLPRLLFTLGSAFGSDTEGIGAWLGKHTHADTAQFHLFPHPGLVWGKRF
ncbi:MAG TPA: PHP-associated domain-containing protein [Armatimonadota bacterium]|jgi:hypothetical protein